MHGFADGGNHPRQRLALGVLAGRKPRLQQRVGEHRGWQRVGEHGSCERVNNARVVVLAAGVGGAGKAMPEFVTPVAGVDHVRVRIDEAGDHRASACVEVCSGLHRARQLRLRPGSGDARIPDRDRACLDDAELAHRGAAAGSGRSRKRNKLADIMDEQISVHGILLRR